MASGLTFRNIPTPNFSGSNQLITQGGNTITQSLRNLAQQAQGVQNEQDAETAQVTSDNTNNLLARIRSLDSVQELDSLTGEGGELSDANLQGQDINLSQVRQELLGATPRIRRQAAETDLFERALRTQQEQPFLAEFGLNAANARTVPQVRALRESVNNLPVSDETKTRLLNGLNQRESTLGQPIIDAARQLRLGELQRAEQSELARNPSDSIFSFRQGINLNDVIGQFVANNDVDVSDSGTADVDASGSIVGGVVGANRLPDTLESVIGQAINSARSAGGLTDSQQAALNDANISDFIGSVAETILANPTALLDNTPIIGGSNEIDVSSLVSQANTLVPRALAAIESGQTRINIQNNAAVERLSVTGFNYDTAAQLILSRQQGLAAARQ